jgi:hypothetical protein
LKQLEVSLSLSASAVLGQINAYKLCYLNWWYCNIVRFWSEGAIANGTMVHCTTSSNQLRTTLVTSRTLLLIPEINIQMRSLAIVAKTRKLKAVWTPEFAQDLNAYQALDAEAEVTNIMSEHISLEIDSEILAMLIQDAAAGTEYWSVTKQPFLCFW